MATDNSSYVGRKPRHQVGDPSAVTVRLTRSVADQADTMTVELLDFARSGARLRFTEPADARPFAPGERVTVRLVSENSKFDLELPAAVRWQSAEGPGLWLLGCEFKEQISLEVLGELFLNEILNDGRSLASRAVSSR
ncbi:MAG TPA: PilZ domain-containing protein [Pirellulales bacterium]|nr:PilZ domain-containing protein [Pirellulales bacterium]